MPTNVRYDRKYSSNPNTGEPCLLDKLDAKGMSVKEYCAQVTGDAETLMGISSTAAATLCAVGTLRSHPGRKGSVSAGQLQERAEGLADYWKYQKVKINRGNKLNADLGPQIKKRLSDANGGASFILDGAGQATMK